MMRWRWLLALLSFFGCAQSRAPLTVVAPGVYRSGQPMAPADWEALRKVKVKHVIKLNFETEHAENAPSDFDVHYLPLQPEGDKDVLDDIKNTFVRPDPETLVKIEMLLASARPDDAWLVHCQWGHDRTGFVTGRYLVLEHGWTKDQAHAWMISNGFHTSLHGLQDAWEDWRP
jgi:protein tyrosine/serine phosphatase